MPFYGLLENTLFFLNPYTDIFNLNYLNCAKMTVTSKSFTKQPDTRPLSNPLASTVDDRVSEYKTRFKTSAAFNSFYQAAALFYKELQSGLYSSSLAMMKKEVQTDFYMTGTVVSIKVVLETSVSLHDISTPPVS